MSKVAVADSVKKLIMQNLSVDESKIVPEARFTDDLGADSLDQVEIVMALEEAFELEISDEEAEKIQTVGHAIQYIEEKLNNSKENGKAPAA